MAADIRANVGSITIGTNTFAYCTNIEVTSDDNPIKVFAGGRDYPIYVGKGNAELTITIDAAEYHADEAYILETVKQNRDPVTVTLNPNGEAGFPTTVYTNCVVTNYTVTSAQGDYIKARVILSKVADS